MAVAWPLIITIIVLIVLILVASLYILVYFQHPEDRYLAWFPKVIIVCGLSLACYNVILLPLDVLNRNLGSTLDFTVLMFINYILVAVFILIFVPFGIFYYEAEEADETVRSHQLSTAFWYTTGTVVISILIAGILYALIGKAEVPVKVMFSELQGVPLDGGFSLVAPCAGCSKVNSKFELRVTFVVFLISLLALVGLFFFIFFGGIGLTALPMDLINDFRTRPMNMDIKEYSNRKIDIGRRAKQLIEQGNKMKQAESMNATGKKSRAQKNELKQFKKDVYILEQEFDKVQSAFKNTRHPFVYWMWLFMGIIGGIISFMWIIHIICFMFTDPYLHPFLNNLFIGLDEAFPLFGTGAYCVFTFYLLWCVIKGNMRVGLRFFCFSIHPMKWKATMMNSFLFNVGLVLLCSIYVAQFCTSAFAIYTRLTAVGSIFDVQMNNLMGLKYVFVYANYVLVGFSLLAFLALLMCPKERVNEWDDAYT